MKITWLGEDTASVPGPSFIDYYGFRFEKGKPVEVADEAIAKKLAGNQFFKAEGNADKKPTATPPKPEKSKPTPEQSDQPKPHGYHPTTRRAPHNED